MSRPVVTVDGMAVSWGRSVRLHRVYVYRGSDPIPEYDVIERKTGRVLGTVTRRARNLWGAFVGDDPDDVIGSRFLTRTEAVDALLDECGDEVAT